MTKVNGTRLRASSHEEIKPLVELCKAGKLFEIQDWISAGNPVNPPPLPVKGIRKRTPLDIVIERGFHSLVKVLLDAGAIQEPEGYGSPMNQALTMRRMDIVMLLVDHGFDPRSVDMCHVFDTWDADIMEYFIERGASVEEDSPFTYAFCQRVRTAFRVFKRYQNQFPNLLEQANTALRHHAKEGNVKWVSLMLWAGADPYAPGPDDIRNTSPGFEGFSAIELAAMYNHYEILELKQLKLNPKDPRQKCVIYSLCNERGFPLLKQLLERGLDPNDVDTGVCSTINSLLNKLDWEFGLSTWERPRNGEKLDTSHAREAMKAIHMLLKHGAKWNADDKSGLNSARRSLLKMKPDYIVEFIWLLSKYKSCHRGAAEALIGTPTMKRLVTAHRDRIQELLNALDDSSKESTAGAPAGN